MNWMANITEKKLNEIIEEHAKANARIAELEAANQQTKQNCELEVSHYKRIADEARSSVISAMQPSVLCAQWNVQNCGFCDRLDCDDNTSEAKQRIAELEAVQRWHPASEQPKDSHEIILELESGTFVLGGFYNGGYWPSTSGGWRVPLNVKRWHDLP